MAFAYLKFFHNLKSKKFVKTLLLRGITLKLYKLLPVPMVKTYPSLKCNPLILSEKLILIEKFSIYYQFFPPQDFWWCCNSKLLLDFFLKVQTKPGKVEVKPINVQCAHVRPEIKSPSMFSAPSWDVSDIGHFHWL